MIPTPSASDDASTGSFVRLRWADAAMAALLAGLVAIAFAPVLANDFVNWDDDRNFLKNPYFRGLGWTQVEWAWKTTWLGVYQPLTWMLYELQFALGGMNPWGYHLTSLVLHALNAVVLYVLTVELLTRLSGSAGRAGNLPIRAGAALAALLFAVHPLRVEVVAWTSCQGYLPCALFAMLAALAYARHISAGGMVRNVALGLSLCFYIAACLCHATALGLPLVLLALDLTLLRPPRSRSEVWSALKATSPFFVAGGMTLMIGWAAKDPSQNVLAASTRDYARIGANVVHAFWFYPYKTVVPWNLCVHYPRPGAASLANPYVLAPALASLLLVGLLVRTRGRPAGGWLAAGAYAAILLPNIGLVEFGSQLVADRYSYLASIPPTIAMSAGIAMWIHRGRRAAVLALVAAAVIPLVILTRAQCRTWRNSEVLWTQALSISNGRHALALCNLGCALAEDPGRLDEAIRAQREAIRVDPKRAMAHYNLGTALRRQGRVAEALECYRTARTIDPAYLAPRLALGRAYYRQGQYDEAAAEFSEAVRIAPRSADAHRSLALAARRLGDGDLALREFRESLKLEPGSAPDRLDLARLLVASGRVEEAKGHLRAVLRLRPGLSEARAFLRSLDGGREPSVGPSPTP